MLKLCIKSRDYYKPIWFWHTGQLKSVETLRYVHLKRASLLSPFYTSDRCTSSAYTNKNACKWSCLTNKSIWCWDCGWLRMNLWQNRKWMREIQQFSIRQNQKKTGLVSQWFAIVLEESMYFVMLRELHMVDVERHTPNKIPFVPSIPSILSQTSTWLPSTCRENH